jgi:IS4 transposase
MDIRLVTAMAKTQDEMIMNFNEMKFLTNNFTFSPTTIEAIYRDRWQIETFF